MLDERSIAPREQVVSQFAVILAAAGKSSRFGDPFTRKVFATIASKPLWMYAAEAFSKRKDVAQLIIVVSRDDKETFNEKYAGNAAMLGVQAVLGGEERADSVLNGLQAVRDDLPMVAIHDAARPCLAEVWIDAVFAAAETQGAAILATPISSTIKRVSPHNTITETVSREGLWLAQTPQVFRKDVLLSAYEQHKSPSRATDEASIVEAAGYPVAVVEGSPLNVKVTNKADMKFAELALKALPRPNPFPFG